MDLWTKEAAAGMEAEGCELVGKAMAPLVGNGILVGFAGQAALSLGLSLWVFFLTKHGNLGITNSTTSIEREIERRRLDFVSSILMTGSDIQSTLGIAYMVTTFAQIQITDLYHLHLVFDIVSFVGVSNVAALVCWRFCRTKLSDEDKETQKAIRPKRVRDQFIRAITNGRYRAMFLFLALYLALLIVLGIRLNEWAPNVAPGRCYYSHLVSSGGASHPSVDQIYIASTGSWLIVAMLAGMFFGVKRRRFVLVLSMLHFPLHLYMFIALRQANQGKFEGEEKHENNWDFGQTTAVILLCVALVELLTKGKEFYDLEKQAAKQGMSRLVSQRSSPEMEEGRSGPDPYDAPSNLPSS